MKDKCNYCGKDIKKGNKEQHEQKCEKINDTDRKNKVCKDIVEALKKLVMDTIEEQNKKELKVANKRKNSNDLGTLLKYNTTYELQELLEILNIKYKSSDNKEMLINRIRVNYITIIKNKIKYINYTCYKDLKFICKNKGIIHRFDIDKIQSKCFLQSIGVLYPSSDENGEFCLSSPLEILEITKYTDKSKIINNTNIIKLLKGATYYYGIISLREFINLIPNKLIEYYDISDIDNVLDLASEIDNEFSYINNVGMHMSIDDENEVLEMIDGNMTSELEFKVLTEEELLKASGYGYIGEESIYKPLCEILYTCYEIERDDLDEILKILYITLQFEGKEGGLKFLYNEFEIPDIIRNEIINSIEFIYNKIPLWKYKGYSINEINSPTKTRWEHIKLGRNIQCPCGSGKKYKECCGSKIIKIG